MQFLSLSEQLTRISQCLLFSNCNNCFELRYELDLRYYIFVKLQFKHIDFDLHISPFLRYLATLTPSHKSFGLLIMIMLVMLDSLLPDQEFEFSNISMLREEMMKG